MILVLPVAAQSGVVIGDSIAMGHSGSRMHYDGTINWCNQSKPNEYGSWAYGLQQETGMTVYNNAMSGANTTVIWNRFARDAIGLDMTSYEGHFVQDFWYQPMKTLPERPAWVVIGVGSNDIAGGWPIEAAKARMVRMAAICQQYGVKAIFYTVVPRPEANQTQIADLNAWMQAELPQHGAVVWDAYSFFVDPAQPWSIKAEYDSGDHVHPNEAGLDAAARQLYADHAWVFDGSPSSSPTPVTVTTTPNLSYPGMEIFEAIWHRLMEML
jgi:hypothetical protein